MKKSSGILFLVLAAALVVVPALAQDASGEDLYNKKCALCHGKDGVAKKMAEGSANFNDAEFQAGATVESIVKVTAEGKADTKMKGYADKLSEAEIKAIAEYIKSIK